MSGWCWPWGSGSKYFLKLGPYLPTEMGRQGPIFLEDYILKDGPQKLEKDNSGF